MQYNHYVEDSIKTSEILRKDILKFLIDTRKSDPGMLPSLLDIVNAVNENIDSVDDQIRILSAMGAVRANRTLDGSSSPFLLDAGYLLYEQLTTELAIQKPDPSTTDENVSLNFSDDYANVVWEGKTFTFNKTQALCVRILHEEFLNQVPWVPSDKISKALHDHSIYDDRMSHIFTNHEAWKSFIIFKGSNHPFYRLNIST